MSDWFERFKAMAKEQERLEEEQGGGLLIPDWVPWEEKVAEMQKGSGSVYWVWTTKKPSVKGA